MILGLAVFLLIIWFLGFLTAHTLGGLLHILLLLALIAIVVDIFRGRKAF